MNTDRAAYGLLESFELDLARATACSVAIEHRPRPTRFPYHHIQPVAAGGRTTRENLIPLCDNCHMAVHHFLWLMAQGQPTPPASPGQLAIAYRGFELCRAAGTLADVPNEG